MLAEGRTARSKSIGRCFLLVLLAMVMASTAVSRSAADVPTQTQNPDASSTVTWTMNTVANLTPENVTVGSGQAVLPWVGQNLSWTQGSAFAANGDIPAGMDANASGLGLRGDWHNYVSDGNFSSASSWTFLNGTTQNVTAQWNPALAVAVLGSEWGGAEVLWESMDSIAANWYASAGSLVVQNGSEYPTPKQGTGTLGIDAVTGGSSYVGATNLSLASLNWSSYDRLVLSVYTNVSVGATFNLTAREGTTGPLLTTVAKPLGLLNGWQEVVVNLSELGDAATRADLHQVGLRFNPVGTFAPGTWFNVDDVRLGAARIFNETATVAQGILKPMVTSPLPGSAHLSFSWCLVNATGAINITPAVSLAPVGIPSYTPLAPIEPVNTWHAFSSDVSSATAANGTYDLTFALGVISNTTGPFRVDLLIDNVSLVFPDIANGTYNSYALTMGQASEYLSLAWTGHLLPNVTSVRVGLRTGDNAVPGSASWSNWSYFTSPGPNPVTAPGASNFQVRVDLGTLNASVSPLVQSLTMETRHRGPEGNLTSDIFPADSDFLRWRTFNASFMPKPRTSISFWLGNGTSWVSATPGQDLSDYLGGPRIRWRAVLKTQDGLQTPTLVNVSLVYEFLGPVVHLVISPGGPVHARVGEWTNFQAATYDAGWHPVTLPSSSFSWTGGDPGGKLYQNGSYLPAAPGQWNVSVSAAGLSATVLVIVANESTAGGPSSLAMALLTYGGAVAVAAAVGFAVYELVIRRMFAIDDVFLIAKDGRLMLHNTRRMRADRDEDILSGMLTAIMTFLRDQDPEENGELKKFQVGGKTTLLERGPHVYLAAVYSGRVPRWAGKDLHRFMVDLERRFGDAFAHWSGSPEDLHGLKDYMRRFVSHVRYHPEGSVRGWAG